MNEPNPGADFLQKKYKLNTDSGVIATAKKPEYLHMIIKQEFKIILTD